jgi:hypothetical protein
MAERSSGYRTPTLQRVSSVAGDQSRTALVPVYDGFPAWFDMADLQEASALLVELARLSITNTVNLSCGAHFFETHSLSMSLQNET